MRLWSEAADFARYAFWIAQPPVLPPPTLWVEWRFRSNFPLGPILTGCDGGFSVQYNTFVDRLKLTGDSVITGEGGSCVFVVRSEGAATW